MITIDQLLESVDLDFEPRWVTKDSEWDVTIWAEKPTFMDGEYIDYWSACGKCVTLEKLQLAELENKDCQECIYEVPQKTDKYEQNLEKLRPADSDLVYRVNLPRKTTMKIEKLKEVSIIRDGDFPSIESTVKVLNRIINRLNELVDAVNELKGAKNDK